MITRTELEALTRDALIERAQRFGVPKPEVMTRVELADEILRRVETDTVARKRARGWLGVARDLVASLIEQGFNMPDAAALVRTGGLVPTRIVHQPPVATVTLAEIYAAQGHVKRALSMLDQVLEKEPDHTAARTLRQRLSDAPPRPARAPARVESSFQSQTESEAPLSVDDVDAEWEQPPEPAQVEPVELAPEPRDPEFEPVQYAVPEPETVQYAVPEPVHAEPDPEPERGREPARVIDRDAVVTARGENGAVRVYWELSDKSVARGREKAPGGRAVVRVIAVMPSLVGPRRAERALDVVGASGTASLEGIAARAVVRAVLGWKSEHGFVPFAVGVELERSADRVGVVKFAARRVEIEPGSAEQRALDVLGGGDS